MGCLRKFTSLLIALITFIPDALSVTISVVDKPLDPHGYGYTSHEDGQQMFDHFDLASGALVNQVSWYGQFSDGLFGNAQSLGDFNIFLFRSDAEEEIVTPEGTITTGIPSDPAFVALRSQAAAGIGTGITDPLQGGDIKMWCIDIPTVYLDPGKYWMTICATAGEPGFYLWNHSAGTADGVDVSGTVSESNEPIVWSSSSVPERESMAFALRYVTVPETPQTRVLLAIGVAAVFALDGVTRTRKAAAKCR